MAATRSALEGSSTPSWAPNPSAAPTICTAWGLAAPTAAPCLAELHQLHARQPLRPVMCERVRGLVAEHHREARLVLRQRQDAAVHGDLPAGQAPGVHGLGVVDQRDLPLVPYPGWKLASAASAIRFATRWTIALAAWSLLGLALASSCAYVCWPSLFIVPSPTRLNSLRPVTGAVVQAIATTKKASDRAVNAHFMPPR